MTPKSTDRIKLFSKENHLDEAKDKEFERIIINFIKDFRVSRR